MSKINTADRFDEFTHWLSGPGTKLIRLDKERIVRSSSTLPSLEQASWIGLHLIDFLRSRTALRSTDGEADPAVILERSEWEGVATYKNFNGSAHSAELFFVGHQNGEGLLRWKSISNRDSDEPRLLEIMFNSLTQGMMVTDLSGTVLRINPAIYQRMKQSEQDRLGKKFWESHEWLAAPESIERVRKDLIRAAAGERVTEIYQTIPFGQRQVYLKLQMHPVQDAQGKVEYVAIEGTPVTQEVEDRKQLDLQRTIIRTFFEFIPLPVWVIDMSGRLIMMNDAYAEVYGLSESDIGKNIYAKRSEKISEQCIRNNQQVFRSGIPLHSVEYIKDLKGDTRIYHVTKFPIDAGGGIPWWGAYRWT